MNDKFNFFDIYGYLLPGILLLALTWLPFGIRWGVWPPADWGSAVVAATVAYVAGHIIDAVSRTCFQSKFRDLNGKPRQPSDLLFDDVHQEVLPEKLTDSIKQQLKRQIREKFGCDDPKAAFFLCRSYLICNKAAAYSEQQQGMYVLMRGVMTAFAFASSLYLGLFVALVGRCCPVVFVLGASAAITLIALWAVYRHWFWVIALFFLCAGLATTTVQPAKMHIQTTAALESLRDPNLLNKDATAFEKQFRVLKTLDIEQKIQAAAPLWLFAMLMVSLVLVWICWQEYRRFAVSFAATVYRDFNALVSFPPPAPAK